MAFRDWVSCPECDCTDVTPTVSSRGESPVRPSGYELKLSCADCGYVEAFE